MWHTFAIIHMKKYTYYKTERSHNNKNINKILQFILLLNKKETLFFYHMYCIDQLT